MKLKKVNFNEKNISNNYVSNIVGMYFDDI